MKKRILVSVDAGETRVAVLEAKGTARGSQARGADNRAGRGREAQQPAGDDRFHVAELYVERRGSRSIVGNIYKGVVDNVLPGMEAA
ncbi:MAG: ribonuclease E, partial [Actinomycetota bacterium]|nr:ribonuclease E [Actinomycetota bacterium]